MADAEHMHNEISGDASIIGPVVQAGRIGAIHFHGTSADRSPAEPPGQPLAQVVDPFELEVHRAIGSPRTTGLPELPVYVPREHDHELNEVVERAAAGVSGLAVLVGGSSTGKTRACWEALHLLRGREEPWRLWHPIDPTCQGAALAGLPHVVPHTVVWLNEAQFYLSANTTGEQVAAGLRNLLRDPRRGPVLVLATLWPDHWTALTARTAGDQQDRRAQARELLTGHKIKVPDVFTGADLAALADQAGCDPRLAEATGYASDGRITQYLAGVPVLMDRYQEAAPATKALIHAAMDARRLGAGPHLPQAWLAAAAPGYLTDAQWHQTGDDWWPRALDYVTTPCGGIPGIFIPVKTRIQRNRRGSESGPLFRLTDYLEQYGPDHRADTIPPTDFWAAAVHAHPADLEDLGDAAFARGLLRESAQLLKRAAASGDALAASVLVQRLHDLHPADFRPAGWAAACVALDDADGVAWLLSTLWDTGAHDQLRSLLARNPAAHVALDKPHGFDNLLHALHKIGARDQIAVLLARNPASLVPLTESNGIGFLLRTLSGVGAHAQLAVLANRVVAHSLDHPSEKEWQMFWALREAGAHQQLAMLVDQAPLRTPVDDMGSVEHLLGWLRNLGAHQQKGAFAARVVAQITLDDQKVVTQLLRTLHEDGAHEQMTVLADRAVAHALHHPSTDHQQLLEALRYVRAHHHVTALVTRDAAHVAVDDLRAVASLLHYLRDAGAPEHTAVLVERAAASLDFTDPIAVAHLMSLLHSAGAEEQLTALLARDPATHASLDDAVGVTGLLQCLRQAGAHDQVAVLLARDPAAHAPVHDPGDVAGLLYAFREAGGHDQVRVLLARDPAAHVSLDNPHGVTTLLEMLAETGAREQITRLADRVAARGPFNHQSTVDWTLLEAVRNAGAQEQHTALIGQAAAHVSLEDPNAVSSLLWTLRETGAHDHMSVVLARDPANQVALHNMHDVLLLLERLREVRAREQAAALAERLPAAGLFYDFVKESEQPERFRFGREPDGSPSPPWGWQDLD